MTLDSIFKEDLAEYTKNLPESRDVAFVAQDSADEYLRTETPIEDQMGFEQIDEDLMVVAKDEAYGIVEENEDAAWDMLCKENTKDDMLASIYDGESINLINRYYGKPFEVAVNNGEDYALKSLCSDLIISMYVQVQGGWFDQIYDAFFDAVYEKYESIVEDS